MAKDPKYYVGQRVQFTKNTIIGLTLEFAKYYAGDKDGKKLSSILLEPRTIVSYGYDGNLILYQVNGQDFGRFYREDEIEAAELPFHITRFQDGYTSEEQVRRLLQLGIPCDSADMVMHKDNEKTYKVNLLDKPYTKHMEVCYNRGYMPCWSAFRLMLIINRWYDENFDGSFPNTTDVKVSGMNYVEYLVRQIEKFEEKKA